MKRPATTVGHPTPTLELRCLRNFCTHYDLLHANVRNELKKKHITPDLTGVTFMSEHMNSDPTFLRKIAQRAAQKHEETQAEKYETKYHEDLTVLATMAGHSPTLYQAEPMTEIILNANPNEHQIDTSHVPKASLDKWREWKPRDLKKHTGLTNMRAIERELKLRWTKRAIRTLSPYKDQLPSFLAVWDMASRETELVHLFGNVRWPTIRLHTITLEKLIEADPDWIPTAETKIRDALNDVKEQQIAASNCDKILRCANYFERLTGLPEKSKSTTLHNKANALKQEMQTNHYKQAHQAPTLSFTGHQFLEQGIVECTRQVIRDAMTHATFLLYSSGRYSDGQHASRDRIDFRPDTTEVDCWSTKTTGTDKTKAQKRLIAPHCGMTDVLWWEHFKALQERLDSLIPDAKERDFLFPTPNRNLDGYFFKPCPNSTFLRLVRLGLGEMEDKYGIKLKPSPRQIFLGTMRVQ